MPSSILATRSGMLVGFFGGICSSLTFSSHVSQPRSMQPLNPHRERKRAIGNLIMIKYCLINVPEVRSTIGKPCPPCQASPGRRIAVAIHLPPLFALHL
ncbi:hypothetical protein F5Y04DRAFT_259459 [Hypomontagnella monticulosa]|nr:hypothetical protein F5Y04DRAFT_259459 [Hypomontagnella monticulosa]